MLAMKNNTYVELEKRPYDYRVRKMTGAVTIEALTKVAFKDGVYRIGSILSEKEATELCGRKGYKVTVK